MILKKITTANGPATCHVLRKVEMVPPFNQLVLTVDSFATEDTFHWGGGLMVRMTVTMPAPTTPGHLIDDAENFLATDASSQYQGGVRVSSDETGLAEARARKLAELSFRCGTTIAEGFKSSALGSEYLYPADAEDRANLVASVLDSTILENGADWVTPFKCTGADGVKGYQMHTAAQIQKVGRDGKESIVANLMKNEQLAAQVAAATTVDEVNAVNW